jgi:hypothetical protein
MNKKKKVLLEIEIDRKCLLPLLRYSILEAIYIHRAEKNKKLGHEIL